MDNFEFENKKKKKLKKEPFYIVGCLICLLIGAGGGYFYHDLKMPAQSQANESLYDQIAQTIESDFLDTTESESSLQERMMAGMVAALGDSHSAFMDTKQNQDLKTSINGSFQGIGITFTTVDVGAMVLDVYQGTPAAQAGILAGDIITHVQGTSIEGYTSEKIKNAVQGENGSEVSMRLLRDGKTIEVKAKRSSVETSVAHEIRTVGQQKVGYLILTTFGETTQALVETALKDFQKQKVEQIVIDLRENGGGYLDAAQNILDLFIPEGETVVQVEPKSGQKRVYKATNRQKYIFKKGYILVNGNSASASEVTASALRELLGYQLVGTTTYGKGTAQTQKTLSDSSVIKYTHAKWLTPKGEWVNGKGLAPDYEVKMTSVSDFHAGEMKNSYRYDQVNENIQYMQEILKELGYQVDRVDGYFSKGTETALKAFEKKYGLKINGIYEKNDATLLLSALGYHLYQRLEDNQYAKVVELMK